LVSCEVLQCVCMCDVIGLIGTPSQEKVICFFQFLMSGLEIHANSMLGRYISLLTKAFVPQQGDEARGYRSTTAASKVRRTLRKGHKSASTLTTIERDLSKQSRLVNRLKYVYYCVVMQLRFANCKL